MKNIAILTGGDSAEYDISILSANTVLKHLNTKLFNGYIIHLKNNNFTALINKKEIIINKTDFTFKLDNKLISFDAVFMALHGSPAENGVIQPYFEKLKIPYTACNAAVSALTFDKYECNKKLNELGFNCAKSYIYKIGNTIDTNSIIRSIGLPCFVKPNGAGSSYGVSKVNQISDLKKAINHALEHDNKVLIEQSINGTEISVGVFSTGKSIESLPITEIITKNDFFDYEAKYKGESEEITPARISETLTKYIQKETIAIYKRMELTGICRIDYIIEDDTPFVIEINTIPGLSEESIIPKQLRSANIKLSEVLDLCLRNVN
ncbi:D-alanine--D-alanine ligase [Flavobacteriales bacterium]|nr:D-alanine--D-alanine ligase [Flavobacteriales bacterium]